MQALKCEMCGSNDLIKQDGMYVCQNCGTKYSPEEAKKMMGTVVLDRTPEAEKLSKAADGFYSDGSYKDAQEHYTRALGFDPDNTHAIAFKGFALARQSTIDKPLIVEMTKACVRAITTEHENVGDTENYFAFCNAIISEMDRIMSELFHMYLMHYTKNKPIVPNTKDVNVINNIKAQIAKLQNFICDALVTCVNSSNDICDTVLKLSTDYAEANETLFYTLENIIDNNRTIFQKFEIDIPSSLKTQKGAISNHIISVKKKAAQQRKDRYWEAHADEKARIEEERRELESRMQQIRAEKDLSYEMLEIEQLEKRIEECQAEYNKTILLNIPKKKELNNRLNILTNEKENLEKTIANQLNNWKLRTSSITARLNVINKNDDNESDKADDEFLIRNFGKEPEVKNSSNSFMTKQIKGKDLISITSLSCGILGILFFLTIGVLFDIAGIVLSIICLTKKKKPKSFAIAGIICSIIGILMLI